MKKSKYLIALLAGATFTCATLPTYAASEKEVSAKPFELGVVNFKNCAEGSKIGKQEQNAVEAMQKQLVGNLEKLEKEFVELNNKLNDPDFRDSLSPEAEVQLTQQRQKLADDLGAGRNQFYQMMNQAQYKLVQVLGMHISRASQIVAKREALDMVVTEDACFYYTPARNMTTQIIAEMDRLYDEEVKPGADDKSAAGANK